MTRSHRNMTPLFIEQTALVQTNSRVHLLVSAHVHILVYPGSGRQRERVLEQLQREAA